MKEIKNMRASLLREFSKRGHEKCAHEIVAFFDLCQRYERINALPTGQNRENYRERSCNKKLRLTRPDARALARKLNSEQPEWQGMYVEYPCIFCGSWHAGRRIDGRHYHDVNEPMTDEQWMIERITVELLWPDWAISHPVNHRNQAAMLIREFFATKNLKTDYDPEVLIEQFRYRYMEESQWTEKTSA